MDATPHPAPADDRPADSGGPQDPSTVLELFGIKLSVRNPRLAEVLTMDAAEALGTDVRQLLDPGEVREVRGTSRQAVPEVMISPPTGRDLADSRLRTDMRMRADAIARVLGFDVGTGGVWESPTGVSIVTRVVERPLSYAAAADYVKKIAAVLETREPADVTALVIVDSQQTADVFKVAIRQARLHDTTRTISAENLEAVRELHAAGAIDHARALVLLTPIANADAGELISIIRSAGLDEGAPDPEF